MYIYCTIGIRIGDINKDILDGQSSNPQPYFMRPSIHRVNIASKNEAGTIGTGIEMVKTFNAKINECTIERFKYCVHTKGCDIWELSNNRITSGDILVWVESTAPNGSFGSQAKISHNDLLKPITTFIKSSDRDIYIDNNYLENTVNGNAYYSIILDYGYKATITNNRIENSTSSNIWTVVKSNSFYSIVFTHNGFNHMIPNKVISFEKPTGLGFTFRYFLPRIIHFGNSFENGFPFNSIDTIDCSNSENIVLSPSMGGVCARQGDNTYSTGRFVNVLNDAYVLPYAENYSQTLTVYPCALNNANSRNDSGVVDAQVIKRKTEYKKGEYVKVSSSSNVFYVCTTGGVTDDVSPVYKETKDEVVVDGSAIFLQVGVIATGKYKISMIAYSDNDNQEILFRFRQGNDIHISGQDAKIVVNKRKKKIEIKSEIDGENLGLRINNTNKQNVGNVYIEKIIFERLD